jgi:hypothetical protein
MSIPTKVTNEYIDLCFKIWNEMSPEEMHRFRSVIDFTPNQPHDPKDGVYTKLFITTCHLKDSEKDALAKELLKDCTESALGYFLMCNYYSLLLEDWAKKRGITEEEGFLELTILFNKMQEHMDTLEDEEKDISGQLLKGLSIHAMARVLLMNPESFNVSSPCGPNNSFDKQQ